MNFLDVIEQLAKVVLIALAILMMGVFIFMFVRESNRTSCLSSYCEHIGYEEYSENKEACLNSKANFSRTSGYGIEYYYLTTEEQKCEGGKK